MNIDRVFIPFLRVDYRLNKTFTQDCGRVFLQCPWYAWASDAGIVDGRPFAHCPRSHPHSTSAEFLQVALMIPPYEQKLGFPPFEPRESWSHAVRIKLTKVFVEGCKLCSIFKGGCEDKDNKVPNDSQSLGKRYLSMLDHRL